MSTRPAELQDLGELDVIRADGHDAWFGRGGGIGHGAWLPGGGRGGKLARAGRAASDEGGDRTHWAERTDRTDLGGRAAAKRVFLRLRRRLWRRGVCLFLLGRWPFTPPLGSEGRDFDFDGLEAFDLLTLEGEAVLFFDDPEMVVRLRGDETDGDAAPTGAARAADAVQVIGGRAREVRSSRRRAGPECRGRGRRRRWRSGPGGGRS